MHFLPPVYVTCEACAGKRYNRETLEITYKGLNIADVLQLSLLCEVVPPGLRLEPEVATPSPSRLD